MPSTIAVTVTASTNPQAVTVTAWEAGHRWAVSPGAAGARHSETGSRREMAT